MNKCTSPPLAVVTRTPGTVTYSSSVFYIPQILSAPTSKHAELLWLLFPNHLFPACLQYSPNHHAGFRLYPLHSSLNTAASMNLWEPSSDKVSPLLKGPQRDLISPGKSVPNGLRGPALPWPTLSSATLALLCLVGTHTPAPGPAHSLPLCLKCSSPTHLPLPSYHL